MPHNTLELLALQAPVEKKYLAAYQRIYTVSGYVFNAIRPWQPFEDPTTHEVIEQDFVGVPALTKEGAIKGVLYNTGFTPWSDLLSGIGYLAAFPLGLISGIEFTEGERTYVDNISKAYKEETKARWERIEKFHELEESFKKRRSRKVGP